jgi:hypothetical protein
MTTSKFSVLSSSELASAIGGAGTGFEPAGESCTRDTRNTWQKVAPTFLGGKADPVVCTPHGNRVWFDKNALDGAPAGQRRFTDDAKREIGNLSGGL